MGRIRCQECGKKFWVALAHPVYLENLTAKIFGTPANVVRVEGAELDLVNKSHLKLADDWHYGDPPRHAGNWEEGVYNCVAGDTMNSIPEDEWEEFFGERD